MRNLFLAVAVAMLVACGTDNSSALRKEKIVGVWDVAYDDLGNCTEYELESGNSVTICADAEVILH